MNKNYDNWELLELDTYVTAVKEIDGKFWHQLEETIFYPGGGGQDPDEGTINCLPVSGFQLSEGVLWHILEEKLEGKVHLHVDEEKRKTHAEIHSAQHLLCGLINKKHAAATITFFNNEKDEGAEMAFTDLNWDILQELEDTCNDLILQDLPLEILYPSLEEALKYAPSEKTNHEELRAVKIGDIDYNLCACIHVPSLRYLRALKILSYEKTTRGYRIYFVVGRQLSAMLGREKKLLSELTKLLASPEEDILSSVELLLSEKKKNNQRIADLLDEKAEEAANRIIAAPESITQCFIDGVDGKFLSKVGSTVVQKTNKLVFLLTKENAGSRFFLAKPKNSDYRISEFFTKLKENFDIKGGGSPFMMQGTSTSSFEELSHFFEENKNLL